MYNIVKVELEDFRSFKGKHSFEFPTEPGLYAITGKNLDNPRLGANAVGKTSLLEAIFWCNYGRTTRGLKAGDIINYDATSCSVTTQQNIAGETLTVARTQSPNSLRLNGSIVDQLTLEQHLRLGPEAFTYAVMMPQFGEFFFDKSPADKLMLFSQIMELDYWLDKSKGAAELAAEIVKSREGIEREVAKYKGRLETIDSDIEDLRSRDRDFAKAEAERIDGLKKELAELQRNASSLNETIGFAQAALKQVTQKLAATEKGAKKCPSCGQPLPNKDLTTLLKNQSDFESKLRRHQQEKSSSDADLKRLKAAIATKRENPYATQITQKQEAKKAAKQQIAKLGTEINSLNEDHAAVSFWVGGFKRVRLFIIEQALQQLELEINNSLGSLGLLEWRVELDVERENKSGGVTKGFTVMVWPPDTKTPVKFEAHSGGEVQRLRLAGNLGLANLIMERAGLRNTIEFIDEPSQHLSDEGLLDLADTLHQRALDAEKRSFIIEHNLLDYAYTGVITIVRNAEGSHIS